MLYILTPALYSYTMHQKQVCVKVLEQKIIKGIFYSVHHGGSAGHFTITLITHTHTYTHASMHTHMHARTRTHASVHTHTHMRARTHTHTYARTHTHTGQTCCEK